VSVLEEKEIKMDKKFLAIEVKNEQKNEEKLIIYVGDSKDVIKRIRTNHCNGNVEASAFRRHVAEEKGYKIKSTRRTSGSTRVQIDLPDPHAGEMAVSDYIRSGKWRYVICNSYDEANDFQWYVIDQLKPLLNKDCKAWNYGNLRRYHDLLAQLTSSPLLRCNQLSGMQSGQGVYVFYHQRRP